VCASHTSALASVAAPSPARAQVERRRAGQQERAEHRPERLGAHVRAGLEGDRAGGCVRLLAGAAALLERTADHVADREDVLHIAHAADVVDLDEVIAIARQPRRRPSEQPGSATTLSAGTDPPSARRNPSGFTRSGVTPPRNVTPARAMSGVASSLPRGPNASSRARSGLASTTSSGRSCWRAHAPVMSASSYSGSVHPTCVGAANITRRGAPVASSRSASASGATPAGPRKVRAPGTTATGCAPRAPARAGRSPARRRRA
jgi:hypothetical protein